MPILQIRLKPSDFSKVEERWNREKEDGERLSTWAKRQLLASPQFVSSYGEWEAKHGKTVKTLDTKPLPNPITAVFSKLSGPNHNLTRPQS